MLAKIFWLILHMASNKNGIQLGAARSKYVLERDTPDVGVGRGQPPYFMTNGTF